MGQVDESVVAAAILSAACDRIVRCCGLSKSELLIRAGLDEQLLADPDAPVRASALMALIRYARQHSGDPALGLELACLVDLRDHGFWGYAVLSSASLRERIEAHMRYQRMRTPWRIAVGMEAGAIRIELVPQHVPEDVLPIVIEWLLATALLHFADHLGHRPRGLVLQLSYSKHFVGEVTPQADLTLAAHEGDYGGWYLGDIDGDGQREWLVIRYSEDYASQELYVVRGHGQRQVGELDPTEMFRPVGYDMPERLIRGGFALSGGGDFDGDNSADLLLAFNSDRPGSMNALFLLPGAAKNPE